MKHNFLKSILLFFILLINQGNSQIIRDRWDTLCSSVSYTYPVNEQFSNFQVNSFPVNNQLLILSDSIHEYFNGISSSYLQLFNPSTSSLTPINYNRVVGDYGVSGSAIINTNTTNLSYVFFGGKLSTSTTVDHFILYKYNSLTSAVSSETLTFAAPEYQKGILNMAFFSPTTNHDTLVIFNHYKASGIDSVKIYKKHFNQTGFVNTNVVLPEQVTNISKVFVFNNVMYISGTYAGSNYLFNSTDGLTFTVNTNYASNYSSFEIVDMDTLNNELYLGMNESGGTYSLAKTSDGVTFTGLANFIQGKITSLKKHRNRMWYSTKFQYPSKINPNSSSSTNAIGEFKPNVYYWDAALNAEVLSIDTLGRFDNEALSFRLQKVGSNLLFAGNFRDYTNLYFGTFVYKFVPPVANFNVGSLNKCLNSAYSFSNTSLNADSVRWIKDVNFSASTANSYNTNFNTVGNHTIGLIAISGTQKDTIRYTVNIYSVTINIVNPITGCRNNKIQILPNTPGAISPISYSWTIGAGLSASALNTSTINLSTNSVGTHTFFLTINDVNNCSAYSTTNTLTINPNTNISGVVSSSAVPVSGNVILYRYEPILTKFDSVTYVSTDALGAYSFTNALGAASYTYGGQTTYIVKCVPAASSLQITYAPSALGWKNASVVPHGCVNNSTKNIEVVPFTSLTPGSGILSGKLTEGVGFKNRGGIFAPGNPIKGITVKGGRNPGGDIVNQVTTDASGGFTITGLPANTAGQNYFILVDIPGLDTNSTYYRTIDGTNTQFTDLDFIVDSAKINPVNSVNFVKETSFENGIVKMYPNPSNGHLTIKLSLKNQEQVDIKLNNIQGQYLKTIVSSSFNSRKDILINSDLSELEPGIYFISYQIGNSIKTEKLVISR